MTITHYSSKSTRSNRSAPTQLSDVPSLWWRIDLPMVLLVLVLGCFGIAMIYSSSRGPDPENYLRLYSDRQTLFLALGVVLMFVVALVSSQRIRLGAWGFYAAAVLLLLLVLSPLGSEQRGAQAWFEVGSFQFQPSEFMKLAFIVAMAAFLSNSNGALSGPRLLTCLVIAAIPTLLIVFQPDVGTAVVLLVIAVTMIVVGGVRLRQAVLLGLLAIVAMGLLLSSSLLETYQRERLSVFISPDSEEVDTYNIEQAQIAVGNGGFLGQGYGNGSQTQSGRVPEQHTDFIFTAVGEELGFVGAAGTVVLYVLLLWRIAKLGRRSSDTYGKLVATGVLAMLAFQGFQAAGMTVGIMPVTGIPFPLLSYGGSSMLATCMAVGLVLGLETGGKRVSDPHYIR